MPRIQLLDFAADSFTLSMDAILVGSGNSNAGPVPYLLFRQLPIASRPLAWTPSHKLCCKSLIAQWICV
jgi:hypothetical protein